VGDWLAKGEPFILNVIAEKQFDYLKHFGKGFETDEPAFEGIANDRCPRGVPILTEALGHMQCEPVSHIESGDHRIFLAKVVRGSLHNEDEPMVHTRKSGSIY